MPLQIINAGPPPEEIAARVREAIEAELPGAEVDVQPISPGHFEIRVVSETFAGKNRVQQQQSVYKAITPFMSGNAAPVHAVDRMECVTPEPGQA